MKFSLSLPFDVSYRHSNALAELADARSIMEMATAIEAAGFDACSATDHPFPTATWLERGGHHTLDPFIALSFAAAATSCLSLLTNVYIPAYRNPFLGAKTIASLDAISGGRLILGMGTGYLEGEFEGLGVPYKGRGKALDESVRQMQLAWSGEEVHETGDGYTARGNVVLPRPARLPHPPLWLGGNSAASVRRVIAYGDGWMPFPASTAVASAVRTADMTDIGALAGAIGRASELAEEAGRVRPFDVCAVPFSHSHAKNRFDPAAFVDEVRAMEQIGVTWISLELPAPSKSAFLDNVATFGDEALAVFRQDTATAP
jgi:probable F420-dependent oxidoreductase